MLGQVLVKSWSICKRRSMLYSGLSDCKVSHALNCHLAYGEALQASSFYIWQRLNQSRVGLGEKGGATNNDG